MTLHINTALTLQEQWGTTPAYLKSPDEATYEREDIKVYVGEFEDTYQVPFSVEDFIERGLSVPQAVALELLELVSQSTTWMICDVFGNSLTKRKAIEYAAKFPNAPYRLMMYSVPYDDTLFNLFVTYDDNHLILHNEKDVLKMGQASPLSGAAFHSPKDFVERINSVCQVFDYLVHPYVMKGSKGQDLVGFESSLLLEQEGELPYNDALAVLELSKTNEKVLLANHMSEQITDELEMKSYIEVFYNFPLTVIVAPEDESKPAESYLLAQDDKDGYILTSTSIYPGEYNQAKFDSISELPEAIVALTR